MKFDRLIKCIKLSVPSLLSAPSEVHLVYQVYKVKLAILIKCIKWSAPILLSVLSEVCKVY
jgi:hypothetical protein